MSIKESGQMYLETILILSKQKGNVKSVDVSEYMNYSKPSVSRAMGILKKNGYINVDENGNLILTDMGKELAEKIYERHTVLSSFFEKIGVSKDTAIADACKIEHDISDEAFNQIKKYIAKK